MKKYITFGISIVILAVVFLAISRTKHSSEVLVSEPIPVVVTSSSPVAPLPVPQKVESTPVVPRVTNSIAEPRTHLVLTVEGREYDARVSEQGEYLYTVMKSLSSESAFSFTGYDFSGLGFFVDTINGQKNSRGKYWILYVNGSLAAQGVSQLLVKPGDRIEWRYEDGK